MIKSITQVMSWILLAISVACLFIGVTRMTSHHIAIGIATMILAIAGFMTDKKERTN